MSDPLARLRRFVRELKRRKVYRVAVVYAGVAFVTLQAARLVFPTLAVPGWVFDTLVVLALFGFPIALVLAWAFEVTPDGVQRTSAVEGEAEEVSSESPGEHRTQSRLAMKALVGLGLLGAAVAGGWYLMGGGGESPETSERTVAVLPFQVSGSGAEEWRDGMVSLLSTGLDGAAGLRAIADRTVFAAWDRTGPAGRDASTEEALAVAREVGARYALVGSATALASELRLAAGIYSTTGNDRLGQVEARGSPDSVTALADELTRRAIAVLAEETGEPLRSADLASVTTSSVEALKVYLEGRRHARDGDLDAAIEDYHAAIAVDSTFALPHAGIALSGFWGHRSQRPAVRRAYELSAQLPERERRLVRALYLGRIERRTLAAADSLRRLTRDYPEDPSMWNSLGEFVAHENVPRGVPEVEEAHRRAVELDPGHTAYYDHYVLPAFTLHHDSALAAERIEAMPAGEWKRSLRVPFRVVFGGADARRLALARYDSLPFPEEWGFGLSLFNTPRELATQDTLLRRLLARNDLETQTFFLYWVPLTDLFRGRVRPAIRDLERLELSPESAACVTAWPATTGTSFPDSLAEALVDPRNVPPDASARRLLCTGYYLAERRRTAELDTLIGRLRSRRETAGGPVGRKAVIEAAIAELEGYRAWKAGDLERAAERSSRSNESINFGAIWRGDLYRELGELERAEGWYLAGWVHPVAHERMGRLYEEMGRPEDAAAAYRRFIAAWEDADPELQDRVEAARERLQALNGAEGATDE